MNALIRLALATLLVSAAMLAVAADPQPQSPARPPALNERQAAPDLDVNRAEIEAGVKTEPLADKAQPDGGAVSPMMAEIQAVMDQTRTEVAELAARAGNAPDEASRVVLQQEIAALKKQAELDILDIQARHARQAGDTALAERIEADIALILAPPAPTPPAEPRPAPDSQ